MKTKAMANLFVFTNISLIVLYLFANLHSLNMAYLYSNLHILYNTLRFGELVKCGWQNLVKL